MASKPRSSAPQSGQAGPGGKRLAPQALQTWIRSSPAAVPSQKNCESRLIIGPDDAHAARSFGMNLRSRNSISATFSVVPSGWSTYQTFLDVTK